jgi:uncharacterized membrane protein
MPHFNQGELSDRLTRNFEELGSTGGFGGMLATLVTDPARYIAAIFTAANLENIIWLLLPFGFICCAAFDIVLIGLPIIIKDLLFGYDIFNHHSDILLPFLFIGAIVGYRQVHTVLHRDNRYDPFSLNAFIMMSTILTVLLAGPTPFGTKFWRLLPEYIPSRHDAIAKKALKLIPKEMPVSCSGHLAPYLTHRETLAIFPFPEKLSDVDFIILDTLEQINYGWCGKEATFEKLEEIHADKSWATIFSEDGILVFQKRTYFR